ncbi:hypothetical protein I5Q34_31580 [Streptomyces sp. AV19]|uniref:hypothetical protein n=1 Tax=Streptomyces sp. AV19 TaxID=2793068 RepID=UPI0018FE6251|nr:hypothetical protein [Streptomyces sp. AV19]MBH1938751.1 hypothetical protein [Streptomyces sp. AV19]MDG4534012.1 hypothetical protein [Streptomyces sp. AV19]
MMTLTSATRAALTAVAALLPAAGPALDARAATGRFIYDRIDGSHGRFDNPADSVCHDFDMPAHGADNQTGTDARVYDTYGCGGGSEVVPKRTAVIWGRFRGESVRFG